MAFSRDTAIVEWNDWITNLTNEFGKLSVAGKNVAGFDLPILKMNGFDTSQFNHRCIDPGSLYFTEFGYVPNLGQINELTGRHAVMHDALVDAMDVVVAIRHKMK